MVKELEAGKSATIATAASGLAMAEGEGASPDLLLSSLSSLRGRIETLRIETLRKESLPGREESIPGIAQLGQKLRKLEQKVRSGLSDSAVDAT